MSDLSSAQLDDLRSKAKLVIGIEDDDTRFHASGLAIYHDESSSATAATVAVTSSTIVLVITGGSNAGTDTMTMADSNKDTLTEMVAQINALSKGWVATLLGESAADTTALVRKDATSAFGSANEQTLLYENEELLDLLITNIWDGVESALSRDILSTDFSEIYTLPSIGVELVLRQPNVTQVTMLSFETEHAIDMSYSGSDTHARVEVTDTAVVTTSRVGATTTTTTSTFASNVTTDAMATTISALSGWTATAINSRPSAFLERRGVQDTKNKTVRLEAWDDSVGDYSVEYEAGVITFWGDSIRAGWPGAIWNGYNRARIDYTAGFTTIPSDVEQAIIEAVRDAWAEKDRTGGLKSESLGDYSWTAADNATTAAVAETAAAKLSNMYQRVTP
jgi:hypothetical protein